MSKQKNTQAKAKTKATPLVLPEIKKTAGWKPCLVLSIFTFVLYSNTLNHSFVLDDEVVLTENKFTQQGIKGIPGIFKYDPFIGYLLSYYDEDDTAEEAQKEFKQVAGGRYRPLSLATFALEIEFFGKKNNNPRSGYIFKGNAFVSHLVNILLYLFTTCLLFLILHRLFPPEKDKKWYLSFPLIVSVLFLAHPVHTEVVANIKGRDEIMTLLGSLGALWFTTKYVDTNKVYNLLLSGLCLFLGLLSKENAITFLAVIPLTIYYFVDRKMGRIFISMIPLIAASVLFLLIRASVLGVTANTSTEVTELMNNPFLNASTSETIATIFYTLFIYVKLLFFPHPLTFDYYPYHIEIVSWSNPVAILSLLFYLGITIYAIYGLIKASPNPSKGGEQSSPFGGVRGGCIISYAIWFYLLPLTIVSNLFFPIGAFMGERFVFISSIGFCIFIGWLIYHYLPKMTKNPKNSIYLIGFVMVIILGLYSAKTISRNKAWKDNITLFTTDVKTSKNSAKGNYMVGYELSKRAVYPSNEEELKNRDETADRAVQHLQHAIKIYPAYTKAIEQLGNLYFDSYKDVAKSLHYYAMALQRVTERSADIENSAKIILGRTNLLLEENQVSSTPEEIIQSCDELLKVSPDIGEAYYIKGLVYGKYLNNKELALVNFEKSLSFDFPKTAKYYEDVGAAYGISGNLEKARIYLLKAVELGTNDPITYMNLGVIYQQLGDMNSANLYMLKSSELKESKN